MIHPLLLIGDIEPQHIFSLIKLLVLVAIVLGWVGRWIAKRNAADRARAAASRAPSLRGSTQNRPVVPLPLPPPPPPRRVKQFKDHKAQRCLVTQPGECEWDRILADRATLPKRFDSLGISPIYTPDELVQFLGLANYRALVHLADAEGLNSIHSRMTHYWIKDIPKRGGGVRRLCAPKPRLKAVQRRILREILDKVPMHPAATGFRRGRDVVANAAPHVGKSVVLCYDLRDFFPSIRRRRVAAFFQWLGYHPKVARILSFLCTAKVDWTGFVLPQGAPTSPALANAICYRMDCRLAGLARRFGAAYTRYADDMTFSGDETFKRGLSRFIPRAEKIIHSEGFHLHHGKRRFMRRGDRQRVTGLVVNQKLSVPRDEYDRLKAILHNAAKSGGLESQNREKVEDFAAHLRGRIAWIGRFHPERAAKLRAKLDALAPAR